MEHKTLFSINLMLLLLLLPLTLANYTSTGDEDGKYLIDDGWFSRNMADHIQSTAFISSPNSVPLSTDLDGDGDFEIFIVDDITFKIFEPVTLSSIDSVSTGAASGSRWSNIVIKDIDGDGYSEIVGAVEDEGKFIIAQYNGTSFDIEATYQMNSSIHPRNDDAGEILLGCQSDACIAIVSNYMDQGFGGGSNNDLFAITFDTTNLSNNPTYLETGGSETFCFPTIRSMPRGDPDRDGRNEFFFSYGVHASTTSSLNVRAVRINSTDVKDTPNDVWTASDSSMSDATLNTQGCNDLVSAGDYDGFVGNALTSPILVNLDGSSGDSEVVVGIVERTLGDNWVRFRVYDGDGVFKYRRPTAGQETTAIALELLGFDATNEGDYVSNAFVGSFQDKNAAACETGDGRCDVCMLTFYKDDVDDIHILCGYGTGSFLYSWHIVDGGLSTISNDQYMKTAFLSHGGDHNTDVIGGVNQNLDEIITSWGVLEVDWAAEGSAELGFGSKLSNNATSIIDDAENVGYGDFISWVNNNLYYIDDSWVNSGGEVRRICTNPGTGVWKLNTTVSVEVLVEDVNSHAVSGRVVAYSGGLNEQDLGWQGNSSSGTEFPFTFVANETGSHTISAFAYDNVDPGIIDVENISFAVAVNGLEYGDSESCTTYDLEGSIPGVTTTTIDPVVPTTNRDNALYNTLSDPLFLDLGLSTTVLWIFIMCITIFGLWAGIAHSANGSVAAGITLIALFFEVVLGWYLGFLPTSLIMIITVVSVMIIGLFLSRLFFSHNAGG